MILELVQANLPRILMAVGISIAINVLRQQSDLRAILLTAVTVFATLNILAKYPDLTKGLYQGIGFGTGGQIAGADTADSAAANVADAANVGITVGAVNEQIKNLLPSYNTVKPTKVQTDGLPKLDIKTNICSALRESGFNESWSDAELRGLMSSVAGKKLLTDIDQKAKKASGFKIITAQHIGTCFPKSAQDYRCVINAKKVEAVKMCDLSQLDKDISIIFDKSPLLTAVIQQAQIEIKNLFSKKMAKTEWRMWLKQHKKKSPQGFPVTGTKYTVPWALLEKYGKCFSVKI